MNLQRLGLSFVALFSLANPSHAQTNFTMPPPAGVVLIGAQVVAACGAGTLAATQAFVTLDATGALCTNATGGGGGGAITSPLTAGGADGVANTLSGVQTYARLQMYNGATWDRVLGDTTNGLFVNVKNALAAVGNNADAVAAGASAGSPVVNYNYVWNGSTWDRSPGAAATGTKTSQSSPYPLTATPYTATATGTTGATTATLAGASSVTTYICGFSIRANASAAATGNATVTGVITATLNFTQWTAPNASGLGVTEMIFAPCIPASGTNQSVAVVSAAPGIGGVVSVTAWGYKL